MIYILVIWTVVAGGGQFVSWERDWRPIGEFRTIEHCQKAAADIGIATNRYRCLEKGVVSK